MPSGSSGSSISSGGLKRPYDALDTGKDFDPKSENRILPKLNQKTKYLASDHHQKEGESVIYIPKDKEKRSKSFKESSENESKRQFIRAFLRNQLQLGQKSNYRIPWDRLDPADFINWPENLEIKSPEKYKKEDLALLLSQLENIRWSERFLQRNTVKKHVSD